MTGRGQEVQGLGLRSKGERAVTATEVGLAHQRQRQLVGARGEVLGVAGVAVGRAQIQN